MVLKDHRKGKRYSRHPAHSCFCSNRQSCHQQGLDHGLRRIEALDETFDRQELRNYKSVESDTTVTFVNGQKALGQGEVVSQTRNIKVQLINVLYAQKPPSTFSRSREPWTLEHRSSRPQQVLCHPGGSSMCGRYQQKWSSMKAGQIRTLLWERQQHVKKLQSCGTDALSTLATTTCTSCRAGAWWLASQLQLVERRSSCGQRSPD